MRAIKLLLIAVCLLVKIGQANGQVVRYLHREWKVFDKGTGLLYDQPFEKKLPAHLLLTAESERGLFLYLPTEESISVYINNAYYKEVAAHSSLLIHLDSVFDVNRQKQLIISVCGINNLRLIDSTCLMATKSQYQIPVKSNFSSFVTQDNSKSYFAITLIMCLTFFSLAYNMHQKNFDQYFNLPDLLINYKVDPIFLRTSIEGHYLIAALLASLFFSLSGVDIPFFANAPLYKSLSVFFRSFVYFFVMGVFFYFLKYLVIQTFAWIFSLEKHAMLHFKIFVRISVIWSLVLAVLGVFNQTTLGKDGNLLSFFGISSFLFLTLISIKVSVLINRVARVSTLYLISYLCITEWLPYLIILKLYEKYFS